ncbi:nucleotide synthetase [Brevundimonas sp.]|uniref:nucleotide synthetase n=1 Tax=Brevundimonas sp. TaxID=1871086 RepID=UPI002D3402E0|nr:nucleotide synthetase [Brevundimonas sp.]HYD26327.1 nucleotide synthetase [Brevundimonas sp.]
MTATEPEAFPIGGVPLPSTQQQWNLGEVVYTQYGYDETLPEGHRVFVKIRSYALPETDIGRFVDERIARAPLTDKGKLRRWTRKHQKDDRDSNIYVGQPCWVVIELDPDVDWQFAPDEPGITTKADYKQDNCDLVHVTTTGTRAESRAPANGTCKLIYFVVQSRPNDMDHQGFICNVIYGGKRRDDMIDPDIPNDGGRFPRK